MNSKPNPQALNRLLSRARHAHAVAAANDEPAVAPPGFATRIVARAREQARAQPWWQLVEEWGARWLVGATALAILSVALNYLPIMNALEQDMMAADDPITVVLDLS